MLGAQFIQVWLSLCLMVSQVQSFTASVIKSSPSEVQAKDCALVFYAVPENTIPAQGTIELTAPEKGTFSLTNGQSLTCRDVINKRDDCTVIVRERTFVITTQIQLDLGDQFQFEILNAINNPISTEPTLSWQILTSVGESESEFLFLTATEAEMASYTIDPESDVIGASTDILLKWTGSKITPKGSYFKLQFPIWNPANPEIGLQKSYLQGSVTCTPQSVLSANLECELKGNTLQISGGVTQDIAPLTTVSIRVTGFKNPIDAQAVTGFQVTSQVFKNGVFYPIESTTGEVKVSTPAQITSGKLKVRFPDNEDAGMIQHTDEMQLSFPLPVPLNQGCRVTVTLPTQYSVDTVSVVQSIQAFGALKNHSVFDGTLEIDSNSNSFVVRPCSTYVENDNLAILLIDSLYQYRYEDSTDSLKIYIETGSLEPVAKIEQGISYMPTRGPLSVAAFATEPTIQASTDIRFELSPAHLILVQDNPTIMITFPNAVPIVSSQCKVSGVKVGSSPAPANPLCRRSATGQTMVVSNWLTEDYAPGSPIRLTLGTVVNPMSVAAEDGLHIVILAEGQYAIADFEGLTPWALAPGSFRDASVDPQSYVAYQAENDYEIEFSPIHTIPQNGYVEIDFPTVIIVPDASYSQSTCEGLKGFPSSMVTCQFEKLNNGSYRLRILNAFRTAAGQLGQTYSIRVPGIQNPIQTTATSPFRFITYNSDGEAIDEYEGANIQMLESAKIQNVQIVPGSFINSQRTSFQINMVPSVPVKSNNLVLVTFPPQMSVPTTSSELACSTVSTNLIASVSCTLATALPNTVQVQLTLTNGQINEQDKFGFVIKGIRNPPTTRTTDSLQIRIVDDQTLATINQIDSGITVTTNTPYTISKASIKPESYQPGVATKYLIVFFPEHDIDANGGILVTIPPQIAFNDETSVSVTTTVSGIATDDAQTYQIVDKSARAIYVENVIQDQAFTVGADKSIKITISGLTTPFTNQPTDSFTVSTFNIVSGQFYYFIDTVQNGLYVESECSYPCNTCLSDYPETCTSCFEMVPGQKTGLPYLQLGTCVSECNFGRYFDTEANSCELCSSSCLTCDDTPDNCILCGGENYPLLLGNECLDTCPAGYLDDIASNRCQKCLEPCLTCQDTLSTCTSCDQAGAFPFLFDRDCNRACPEEISVQIGSQCVQCDHSCKTCSERPDKCTSCEQFMKFDPLNFRCTAECKPETQIYVPLTETCETCNPTCSKCQGDVNLCTECKPGFVLNQDFTCQPTCNDDNQTPINGICEFCEEPCYSCSGTVNTCDSCVQDPKYYLMRGKQKCVQYCPAKYNVSSDGMECVYVGLHCPANFRVDPTGDRCIPIIFECAEGYALNELNTACVPAPGSPVPFPFLIAAVFVSFLVLGSYLKEKFFTKVYTCLLSIIGSFEIVMYVLMIGFAAAAQEWLIMGLCSVGMISLLIANATFTIYYLREVVAKDPIFQKWLFFYPKTKKLIPLLCLLLNFKASKIIYSGFYGQEACLAKFQRPIEYYRILRMSSYFSFIFAYGFIYIADLVIITRVVWGYQLLILGIETAVLQTFVIVLTYLESKKQPAELLSVGTQQYTSVKPQRKRELKVKSGIDMDSDDYEEGIPDVDETVMLRSKEEYHLKEIKLRAVAFMKIIKQVQLNCEVSDEYNLKVCMTKFEPQYLKVRRAFSMRARTNCPEEDEDLWSDVSSLKDQTIDAPVLEAPKRRHSWPLLKPVPADEEKFMKQIADIRDADAEYQIDNCLTEVKKVHPEKVVRVKKMVSRRTQTYLRELLQLEGYDQDNESEQSVILDDEAEIDETYAHGLIQHVIDNVSGNENEHDFIEHMSQESVQRAAQHSAIAPEYRLVDIMGEFDIDDLGNFIIIRAAGSRELFDKHGRRVNRRGYLVDRFGNVTNLNGDVIFRALELDQDDEIPAPFDLGHRKDKNTFQIQNDQAAIIQEIEGRKMFEVAEPQVQQQERSQSGSDNNKEDSDESPRDLEIGTDIYERKVPRKRKQMRKASHKVVDNHPPKRIGSGATNKLYPQITLANDEQRKLATITDQISQHANRIALENGRLLLENQEGVLDQQRRSEMYSGYSDARLMSRPQSVGLATIAQSNRRQRPMSSNIAINSRIQARPYAQHLEQRQATLTRHTRPKKVYANVDQLVSFQDQKMLTTKTDSRNVPGTVQPKFKSRQDSAKDLARISEIYMNRSQQQRMPRVKGPTPFRPTLQQFLDDPNELNVATSMDGFRFGKGQAYEVGHQMAKRVDQIQRQYINQSEQAQLMMNQLRQASEMDLSQIGQTIQFQPSQSDITKPVVRQDNWIQ